MKRPKNRLHRVLVVGATPAGIAATSKLGELGIPVTLTDSEPDLDRKLARDPWRLASGLSLNFAQRSALLRILRNPDIRTLLPAHVVKLKHTPQGFRAHLEVDATFVDADRCTLCGRCVQACPVQTPDGTRPILSNGRRSLPGRAVIDKRRIPPCKDHCPLGVNAQGYIALARAGRFLEALEVVRKDNVLPGICGRVCTHPCEEACRRSELDDPVAIRDIKRFLADYELAHPEWKEPRPVSRRQGSVAVVGSGPAGIAAAADLARLGYSVEVFEKEKQAGGLLRFGIGKHRLPREILDAELSRIEAMGVRFHLGHPLELTATLQDLRNRFDAVILATGTWEDRPLGVPGEDLAGVEGCLSFLQRLYREEVDRIEEDVAVIGDGNAAFDLARALRRMGARVTILSWFPEDLIPADAEEVRGAREEGIEIRDRTQVVAFSGNGRMEKLHCVPTEPGPPDENGIPWPVRVKGAPTSELTFERALVAIGQKGPYQGPMGGMAVTQDGLIAVDGEMATGISKVFAAGDATSGPSSVVEAMASGRAAARAVHRHLSGEDEVRPAMVRPRDRDFSEIPPDIPSLHRPTMPERQPGARRNNFAEVALGLNESQVLQEAERCLQCGVCSECEACVAACEAVGAIRHGAGSETLVEHAGAVIIADPEAAPPVKGEDVIRAYGPRAAKPDVYAMICRGYAAAAQAMALLSETSVRPKGRGFSFSPPDPQLSPEIRVGVFACRCNDSMGWSQELETYVQGLSHQDEVVHSETLTAACVPEGTAAILRAVREKGLTRMVLASCVCCPLDFVCSACTDQRSRLKEGLFRGTGISRSMVETCNVRGEALRLLANDPEGAYSRFRGLIHRSIHRARGLKALPTPVRIYNFTTAVMGESESALTSAKTLAEAGLEVLLFASPGDGWRQSDLHPNILLFRDVQVKGLSGTLGDFQVFVESEDGGPQTLQVGAVILGERFRRKIPYYPQGGLAGRPVSAAMQKKGLTGIPFVSPGATSISGLFLSSPPDLPVSERKKGAAAAVLAAAAMPRGPRQSKGYTVVVNREVCRGCGRCFNVCPYQAITFERNAVGGWHARVDEALCKGCGNCISVCPSNAADSPYRDQVYLEQLLEEVLAS